MVASRIALVVGSPLHPRILVCFRALFEHFDTTAFMFDRDAMVAALPAWVQVKLYEDVVNFSGFMRALERDLRDFDVIVGFETDQLCSLQAMRAAHEQKVPFFLFCSQERPAYVVGCDNVNALQHDLLEKADGFFVPSRRVHAALVAQGVKPETIIYLPPCADGQKFKPSVERREKFRQYINVSPDAIVGLYQGDLVRSAQPEMLLKAHAFLKNMNTTLPVDRLRLIFAGQGDYAQELKYLASNLGLGDRTYFLHQDYEPFVADLYAACDVLVYPWLTRGEGEVLSFPLPLLEAMSCGLIPLVAGDSMHAEIAGESDFILKGDHYQNLALSLQAILSTPDDRQALRAKVGCRLEAAFSQDLAGEHLNGLISNLLQNTRHDRKKLMDEVMAIENEAKKQSDTGVLKRISVVLKKEIPLEHKSRLFCLQGEVYTSLGRYDEAVVSFESALQHLDTHGRPYRGLGYVSWHSHSHEEAMMFFKKALALDSNDAHSMLGVGLIYKRIGMIEDAIFWMERSIETCPDEKNIARHALVQACCECPDPIVGISVLERALDLIGDDHMLMRTLGQLNLKAGRSDKGHEILAKYFV